MELLRCGWLRAFMEFHPWYLLEVPVEGEYGKVVLDRYDGDENIR